MVKRTLYFGNPAYLKTKENQLYINYPDVNEYKKIPIEDIGVIILDHYQITFSQALLTKLLGNNVAIISCDAQHLPHGMFLNLNGNHIQNAIFKIQMAASDSQKNKAWQQIIQQKIGNQAQVLENKGIANKNIKYWQTKVKPNDPDNFEGRAAAYYWKHFWQEKEDFKRGRFEPAPNNLLNYGYAILRGVVARSLTASGLLPTLGIHHSNKYNAYCLADDVMEPYRPVVDELVASIYHTFQEEEIENLTPNIKRELLQIPVLDVQMEDKNSPLMVAVQQTTSSLVKFFEKKTTQLKLPKVKPLELPF